MKTAAVITEFNPFHKGHEYFLSQVRQKSRADVLIAVMSGDFVQRGEPAILDKYTRALSALQGGCDIVLELPVRSSLSSAGGFAQGAVSIIHSLGITDELWFGSECGDITKIQSAAEVLAEEPEPFQSVLQASLKEGLPYPAARARALSSIGMDACVLEGSNNILGIEYCIAAKQSNCSFSLHTLPRIGGAYDDDSLSDVFPSALAIRSSLYKSRFGICSKETSVSLEESLPSYSADSLRNAPGLMFADDFSDALRIRLLEETQQSLCAYLNVTPDLANRIKRTENDYSSFTDFAARIKSRNYTYSHVSRALMSIVLKLKAQQISPQSSPVCIRLLGIRKSAEKALHLIHENGNAILAASPMQLPENLFKEDLYASSLYESIRSIRFHSPFIHENTRKFLKI